MKRHELMKYEKSSVRVDYVTEIGEQSRTGWAYSVTQELLILWPYEMEKEVPIKFKDIKKIDTI